MSWFWEYTWEKYADASLWPVHCFTAVCVIGGWTVTTPFRAVWWNLIRETWRVFLLNGDMIAACLTRYLQVVQDPSIQQLRGWEYAGALGGAALSVPSLVLMEDEGKHGRYGRMHLAWWNAWRETLYDYLPDLVADTYRSTTNYYHASWDATGATTKRFGAVVYAVCWFVMLLLSVTLYLPMWTYDFLACVVDTWVSW
ncbi:hypothetical protein PHMEG_00015664 [Phytophthora megakarya]|uniref:Transmembrane protein n=1 Tax=Phytophthora megakarya TaxID=4795 RepID=A0A225W0V8_9STRA|nr:hypothetical protein PHMEG_00015664 [Phytophthora megakarya]